LPTQEPSGSRSPNRPTPGKRRSRTSYHQLLEITQHPSHLRSLHQVEPIKDQIRIALLRIRARVSDNETHSDALGLASTVSEWNDVLGIPRSTLAINTATLGALACGDLSEVLRAHSHSDGRGVVVDCGGEAALVACEEAVGGWEVSVETWVVEGMGPKGATY
jgi:hypothetical protein